MKVRCDTCGEEFEVPDDKFDAEDDYYCSKECEDISGENLLRAVFGAPKINPKMGKHIEPGPTEEELEFLEEELKLIVKNHRIEDSEEAVERLFQILSEMTERGIIEKSPEGARKGLNMVFGEHPDLKYHFEKFSSVLGEEFMKQEKQRERPH